MRTFIRRTDRQTDTTTTFNIFTDLVHTSTEELFVIGEVGQVSKQLGLEHGFIVDPSWARHVVKDPNRLKAHH